MITKTLIENYLIQTYGSSWSTEPKALREIEDQIHDPLIPEEVRKILKELVGGF